MEFTLDFEYKGVLYAITVKCSSPDDWRILEIERYFDKYTKLITETEFMDLEKALDYDNGFCDVVSAQYQLGEF